MATDNPSYRRLFTVLALTWLLLNFDVLVLGRVLPWDALDEFYPTVYFNASNLRAGIAPWWNPYIYGGYAQVGDPQGMLFSPLLMAWMMLPAHPGASWFSWGVLLHMLVGGAAMLALLRRHAANGFGALAGAIVYMAGGVAASRLEHVPIVLAYAYVPLVLLALRWLLERPSLRRGFLLGLATGAMVTHLVQVTYLFVLVIGVYAIVAVAAAAKPMDARQRAWLAASLAVAALVALACGLPQLALTWSSLRLSNRIDLPLSAADAGSFDPRGFLFLLDPNAFDGLADIHASPVDPIQSFLYIGALPILLLAWLGRAWRAGQRRTIVSFATLAGLATLYMLGTHTPVYGWLYGWMPGLTHFRRPADAAYVLNIALAFLVGTAASQFDPGSRRDVVRLLCAAAAWLLGIAILSGFAPHGVPLLAVVVAGLALWQLRKPGSAWRTTAWLVLLLAVDYRAYNFNGTFNASGNGAARYTAHPAVHYLTGSMAHADARPSERVSSQNTSPLWDNMGVASGIASTQGYNPLRYALYEAWYQPRDGSTPQAMPSPYNALPGSRIDDLLGVRFLLVGRVDGELRYPPPPDYRKVATFPAIDVWRNDGAYPRYLNPTRLQLLAVGEMPDAAAFAATEFAEMAWMTPRDADDLAGVRQAQDGCRGKVGTEHVATTHTRIELRTRAASPGWIVAGELDHPGWMADVDGEPLPIHRANGMFRAVCVPAGEHTLTFRFSPWRMVASAWREARMP
ncbi:YfhO family protein [Bacillus sp. NP157]|nr:YfhO family protein [Bacillus sp. NP157]